jgi:hypothetical protein
MAGATVANSGSDDKPQLAAEPSAFGLEVSRTANGRGRRLPAAGSSDGSAGNGRRPAGSDGVVELLIETSVLDRRLMERRSRMSCSRHDKF